MARTLIAILEDNAERIAALNALLDDKLPIYDRLITDVPRLLIERILQQPDDLLILSLDHDLFESVSPDAVGMEVIDSLLTLPAAFPVLVHSSNAPAAARMVRRLSKRGWDVSSVMPIEGTDWIPREWYFELRQLIQRRATATPSALPEPVSVR